MKKCTVLLALFSVLLCGTSYASITITTTTLPQAVEGSNYSAELASYPLGAVWSGSRLPAGLTLDSAGKITGHPTVAGDFTFTVTAKLGEDSASSTLGITINLLEITTSTLPNGMEGSNYSQTLDSNGENLTWMVSAGELPEGLELDKEEGTISGTPAASGEYEFTVYAYNTYAGVRKDLTLKVDSKPSSGGGGGCDSGLGIFGLAVLFAAKGAKKS